MPEVVVSEYHGKVWIKVNCGVEGHSYYRGEASLYGTHHLLEEYELVTPMLPHPEFDEQGVCPGCQMGTPATIITADNCASLGLSSDFIGFYALSLTGHFKWFADQVNEGNGDINGVLTNDIDLTPVCHAAADGVDEVNWVPIGNNYNKVFSGIFDGNGHEISNLYQNHITVINEGLHTGLFGTNEGIIRNLGVAGNTLVLYSSGAGLCYLNKNIISNCYNAVDVAGKNTVGGVCASNIGSITRCYNIGNVTGEVNLGGICGNNYSSYPLTDCYNQGNVTITENGYDLVGGICGISSSDIVHCYNEGLVIGSSSVGGIIGQSSRNVISCYNTGHVEGSTMVGGICGVGPYNSYSISGCFSTGTITGKSVDSAGGILGIAGGTIVNDSYFLPGNTRDTETGVMTLDDFTSGKVAWLLNSHLEKAQEDVCWQQNLGVDALPEFGSKGLYHTRKVSNQYGTVCLPFTLKSDDKISYYRLIRTDTDDQGIKLVFKYVKDENIPSIPVLFRAAEATGANADEPVEVCFNHAGDGFSSTTYGAMGDLWEMAGTFKQKVFDETTDISSKSIYYISGGVIKNARKTTIAPYRAWIYGPNIETLTAAGAKSIKFVVEDEDGETTALDFADFDLVPMQNADCRMQNVYNLAGQKVDKNYRGIVIKNGKKVMK